MSSSSHSKTIKDQSTTQIYPIKLQQEIIVKIWCKKQQIFVQKVKKIMKISQLQKLLKQKVYGLQQGVRISDQKDQIISSKQQTLQKYMEGKNNKQLRFNINNGRRKQNIYQFFSGKSKIYLDPFQPLQFNISELYQRQQQQIQNQIKITIQNYQYYDHQQEGYSTFQTPQIQKYSFSEYILIQFQKRNKQNKLLSMICHPKVIFRCKDNTTKSFAPSNIQEQLQEKDFIKIYQNKYMNRQISPRQIKKITLIKQEIDMYRANVYNQNKDRKANANILIDQLQIIYKNQTKQTQKSISINEGENEHEHDHDDKSQSQNE